MDNLAVTSPTAPEPIRPVFDEGRIPLRGHLIACCLPEDALPEGLYGSSVSSSSGSRYQSRRSRPSTEAKSSLHLCIVAECDFLNFNEDTGVAPITVYFCRSFAESNLQATLDWMEERPTERKGRYVPFTFDESKPLSTPEGFGPPLKMRNGFRWKNQTWIYARAIAVDLKEYCRFPPEGKLPIKELRRFERYIQRLDRGTDAVVDVGADTKDGAGGPSGGPSTGPPSCSPSITDNDTDCDGSDGSRLASHTRGGHTSYRMVNGKIECEVLQALSQPPAGSRILAFIYRSSDGYSDDVPKDYVWDGEDDLPMSYFEHLFAPTDKHAAERVREAEDKHRQDILERVRTWRLGLPAASGGVDWDVAGDSEIQTM
ncbi:hypothetical protein EIP91_007711 [Steccherinum ochraceum]|uniref:Uncharacterized protein n=1 Tax=Steccherinum ochraceum TaxID=92696 RepID=A0A4R0RC34_9APHY|nr:hypothetical protein EIP91_007711 [Steccherinum ochraceum]